MAPQLDGRHVPVIIVGAGQAGLSASWHLQQRGIEHLLLERHTAAHEWQTSRWDNFTLVTPNWQCRLPGFPYPGSDPDGFMTRDEVSAYLAKIVADGDLPRLYGGADALCYPSKYEGFGLPPLEAMACGCPVLCVRASSLPEVVGDAAILLPADDSNAWADALEKLLTQPIVRERWCESGLARAQKFSWAETARQTKRVYEEVLAQG